MVLSAIAGIAVTVGTGMGNEITKIWVFDEQSLELAIRSYREEARAAYPQQAERIDVVTAAIRDFLHSDHARMLVMKPK